MNNIFTFLKKHQIIIIIVIIMLVVSYVIYFNLNKQSMVKFANEKYGYSLEYNKDNWREASQGELDEINIQKRETDLKVQNAFIKNDDKNTTFNIIVQKSPGAKEIDLEQSINKMDEEGEHRHNSFEKIDDKIIKFLGYQAIDYEIEYGFIRQFQGQEAYRRERQIMFLANEKVYRLICSTEPENYKNNKKAFDKILKSFKLIE